MSSAEIPLINPQNILNGHKYIRVITYKKTGKEVATPVWFVFNKSVINIMTFEKAGKAKRIKNNPQVTLCPCTARGQSLGQNFKAHASFVAESEEKEINTLMKKKYGIIYRFLRSIAKIRGVKYKFIELIPQINH